MRLLLLVFLTASAAAARSDTPLSAAALQPLIPDGYRLDRTLAVRPASHGRGEYLVALSDVDESDPAKPVMLLLVSTGAKTVIEDRMALHTEPRGKPALVEAPNYVGALSHQKIGDADLVLVATIGSWGGSGSLHYFDFFRPEGHKLHLVKSFSHGWMQVPYFAVYENAVYDAELGCRRGEKIGKAYVYTCWLDVTKFGFANGEMLPVSSKRMREHQGNRYLGDKYRFISVLKALRNHEIFAPTP